MILRISTRDVSYEIGLEAGSDAVPRNPRYSYTVTRLRDEHVANCVEDGVYLALQEPAMRSDLR